MFKELIIAIDHELIALQACTIHCATITRWQGVSGRGLDFGLCLQCRRLWAARKPWI